ncbi:MAG TPA: carbonic anhydrase [Nitrospiraceae bacterium]|nr:carbonic anhydrase [Nitrospiraceae bacterium]
MKKLILGVKRFQTEIFQQKQTLFRQLAKHQHPRALFITCSDSRIDPCLLTQTEPGELFILRNAGNIVPSYGMNVGSTTATIEYAVGVLEVKNIIVCGHTDCGVVKALLDPKQVEKLPAVKAWLGQAETTRRIVEENYRHLQGDALQVATTQEHVRSQIEHLQTHPTVAARLRKGFLHLHGWVYSIATGDIWAYDAKREIFVSLDKLAA